MGGSVIFTSELRLATRSLPPDLRIWMQRAFDSGDYDFTPKSFDDGSGRHCPVGAAADKAGAWIDGGIHGHPDWGTPEEPGEEVEEFAAYFDLCCDEHGLDQTLRVVESELALGLISPAPETQARKMVPEAA